MTGPQRPCHKSCDACRARKVRCPSSSNQEPCAKCVTRKITCHYGNRKPSRRKNTARDFYATSSTTNSQPSLGQAPHVSDGQASPIQDPSATGTQYSLSDCYIDHLLLRARNRNSPQSENKAHAFIRGNGVFGGSLSLTFFSDARLLSLGTSLGNNKVNELVGRISSVIRGKVTKRLDQGQLSSTPLSRHTQTCEPFVERDLTIKYMNNYFERIHPIYPFLDKDSFESAIFSDDVVSQLAHSCAWNCLYHAVLALGCQLSQGGSYEPGAGKAWELFSIALGTFADLLLQPDSLLVLQAMTAMAVYAQGISCISVSHVITAEAARRAQNLATIHMSSVKAQESYQRAFWVVYAVEKLSSFHLSRNSTFIDDDISCPLPTITCSISNDFDWFIMLIRYARIVSRAYSALFCIGAANKPPLYHEETINQLSAMLEEWRLSFPDNGFRPIGDVPPDNIHGPLQRQVAVTVHYLHASLVLALSRASIHHLPKSKGPTHMAKRKSAISTIVQASRLVLEMTPLIEVEPYTNLWILASIPITALVILFDITVDDPRRSDTAINLAVLDIGGGHFSRIEYRSRGYLPGSLISEFAHIARDYVNDVQSKSDTSSSRRQPQATDNLMASDQTIPVATDTGDSQVRFDTDSRGVGLEGNATASSANKLDRHMEDLVQESHQGSSEMVDKFDIGGFFPTGFEDPTMMESLTGTDVMGIFNSSLPDLDPAIFLWD